MHRHGVCTGRQVRTAGHIERRVHGHSASHCMQCPVHCPSSSPPPPPFPVLHSLHAAIRAMPRPLPEETIWRVLLQVTLALHHMHTRQAGLLHCMPSEQNRRTHPQGEIA